MKHELIKQSADKVIKRTVGGGLGGAAVGVGAAGGLAGIASHAYNKKIKNMGPFSRWREGARKGEGMLARLAREGGVSKGRVLARGLGRGAIAGGIIGGGMGLAHGLLKKKQPKE